MMLKMRRRKVFDADDDDKTMLMMMTMLMLMTMMMVMTMLMTMLIIILMIIMLMTTTPLVMMTMMTLRSRLTERSWPVAKCHARLVLSLCCTLAASHNDNDDDQVGHVGDHAHDYDVIKPVQDIRIVSLLHIGCRSQ